MKLGVISDIHIEEQKDENILLETLSECINECGADTIIIAGDISEDYKKSIEFINALREKISAKLYFTAGNHDLWSKHTELTSEEIINELKKTEGFIHNEAVNLSDDVVLIGGCGWYDYTFGSSEFKLDEYEEKNFMDKTWEDKNYFKNDENDIELHNKWNDDFIRLINENSDKKVVFATHMVNHPAFCVGDDHPKAEMWRYFNAFLGSEELYLITQCENVKVAISGHVHYRESFTENDTYYMCRCLGYENEYELFGGEQDLKSQINAALEVIEI